MRKTSSNLKRVGNYWQASLGYVPQLSSPLIVQCNVPISFSSLDLHVALLLSRRSQRRPQDRRQHEPHSRRRILAGEAPGNAKFSSPANKRTNEGRIARRQRQPNSQPPTAVSQTTSELVKFKQSQNSKRKVNYYSTKSK